MATVTKMALLQNGLRSYFIWLVSRKLFTYAYLHVSPWSWQPSSKPSFPSHINQLFWCVPQKKWTVSSLRTWEPWYFSRTVFLLRNLMSAMDKRRRELPTNGKNKRMEKGERWGPLAWPIMLTVRIVPPLLEALQYLHSIDSTCHIWYGMWSLHRVRLLTCLPLSPLTRLPTTLHSFIAS